MQSHRERGGSRSKQTIKRRTVGQRCASESADPLSNLNETNLTVLTLFYIIIIYPNTFRLQKYINCEREWEANETLTDGALNHNQEDEKKPVLNGDKERERIFNL